LIRENNILHPKNINKKMRGRSRKLPAVRPVVLSQIASR